MILAKLKTYISRLVGKRSDKQSKFWSIFKSPSLRYKIFKDKLDTLLYSLSISQAHIFFIQVGSNDSSYGDPLRSFMLDERWCGIMIEPVDYVFKRLCSKYGDYGRFKLENVAIAEVNGFKDFYYVEETDSPLPVWYDQIGSFSLSHVLKHIDFIPELEQRIRKTQVECITFEELCNRNSVRTVDLIHIDTEGFDYEVLKMIDIDRFQPSLILYEHKHLSDSDRISARSLLSARGYQLLQLNSMDTVAVSVKALENRKPLKWAWKVITKNLSYHQNSASN